MTHTLTTLSPPYITKAFQLIQNEGWTVSKLEFCSLLAYSGTQAFMVVVQDEIKGMIVAIKYDNFGFLGNLIVVPNYRRQGLGTQLLQHAISTLTEKRISIIMLDAVPQAVPLYQRMGFLPICKSLRFRGKCISRDIEPAPFMIQNMNHCNFVDMLEVDQKIFGADRSGLLKSQFQRNPDLNFNLYYDGKLTGYIMATRYQNLLKIGPFICKEPDPAPQLLLQNLVSLVPTSEIYLGILEKSRKGVDLMGQFNIPLQFYSIRMIYGGERLPHSSDMLAIGGPDRG